MITGHNEGLPKNRFGELDALERREHLDNGGKNDLQKELIFPVTAYPYSSLLSFPFLNMGYPSTAPLLENSDDYGEEKNRFS